MGKGRCLRFATWERNLFQKPKGHGAYHVLFGKGIWSKNLRGTALAILYWRRNRKKSTGHGAYDALFGKRICSKT